MPNTEIPTSHDANSNRPPKSPNPPKHRGVLVKRENTPAYNPGPSSQQPSSELDSGAEISRSSSALILSDVEDNICEEFVITGEHSISVQDIATPEPAERDDDSTDLQTDASVTAFAEPEPTLKKSRDSWNTEGMLFFEYLKIVGEKRLCDCKQPVIRNIKMRYKMSKRVWEYNCVRNTLERNGLRRTEGMHWNLYWGRHLSIDDLITLHPQQKVNHFPGTWCIGRKDRLASRCQRMRREHGNFYDFHPTTFIVPQDKRQLAKAMDPNNSRSPLLKSCLYKNKKKGRRVGQVWIFKPANSSCGKGIKLLTEYKQLNGKQNGIVSKYIKNPYLIDSRKFDLRIYVLVTSFDPLIIYIYKDGLVRFSTSKYQLNSKTISKRHIHLTNYSIQKLKHNYEKNDGTQRGNKSKHKWNLRELWTYLMEKTDLSEVKIQGLKRDINELIVKTIISAESHVVSKSHQAHIEWNQCFELFGFDVLIDSKLKPWLLEVNVLPSLSSSSKLDKYIKTKLLCDTMHIIGLRLTDMRKVSDFSTSSRYRGRNIATVSQKLQTGQLDKEDIQLLREIFGQQERRGDFELAFPREHNTNLRRLFETPRYNNKLLWSSMGMSATHLRELISQSESRLYGRKRSISNPKRTRRRTTSSTRHQAKFF